MSAEVLGAAAWPGGALAGGTVAQAHSVATRTVVGYKHRKYLGNESILEMCTNLSVMSIMDRFDSRFQVPGSRDFAPKYCWQL